MPYQKYSDDDVRSIAEYIYDYQIEEPDWFKKHWEERQGTAYINTGKQNPKYNNPKTAADIGLEYALGTKKVLGKNLIGTIQQKGTLEALTFCNVNAYTLTDSMATNFGASIKRVSDKPRNPENTASNKEKEIIQKYKSTISNNRKIEPIVEEIEEGIVQFYYPIITNSMCLQCHGSKNDIQNNIANEIHKLYPDDKATGYEENQVRGIWSIRFKNKK